MCPLSSTLGRIFKKHTLFLPKQHARGLRRLACRRHERPDKALRKASPGSLVQVDTKHMRFSAGEKAFQFADWVNARVISSRLGMDPGEVLQRRSRGEPSSKIAGLGYREKHANDRDRIDHWGRDDRRGRDMDRDDGRKGRDQDQNKGKGKDRGKDKGKGKQKR